MSQNGRVGENHSQVVIFKGHWPAMIRGVSSDQVTNGGRWVVG